MDILVDDSSTLPPGCACVGHGSTYPQEGEDTEEEVI
jgi:hypothetical protein